MEEHLLKKRPKHTSPINNHIWVYIPTNTTENRAEQNNIDSYDDMDIDTNDDSIIYKRQMTLGHYYPEAKRRRNH